MKYVSIFHLLGLLKLIFYKYLLNYKIDFYFSAYFHPSSIIKMKRGASLKIGKSVKIEKRITITINNNGILEIKNFVHLRQNSYFEIGRKARMLINDSAFINRCAQIVCMENIVLGEHIAIGTGVSMFDHDHCYVSNDKQNWGLSKKGSILIERDVWIGANVVLLRDTKICNNSVVAAGVVLKGNVPANTLMYLDKVSYSFRSIK